MEFSPELELKEEEDESGITQYYLEDEYEHFKIHCTSEGMAKDLLHVINCAVTRIVVGREARTL